MVYKSIAINIKLTMCIIKMWKNIRSRKKENVGHTHYSKRTTIDSIFCTSVGYFKIYNLLIGYNSSYYFAFFSFQSFIQALYCFMCSKMSQDLESEWWRLISWSCLSQTLRILGCSFVQWDNNSRPAGLQKEENVYEAPSKVTTRP